jgi:hypothetical protein
MSTAKVWIALFKFDMIASSKSLEFGFKLSYSMLSGTSIQVTLAG